MFAGDWTARVLSEFEFGSHHDHQRLNSRLRHLIYPLHGAPILYSFAPRAGDVSQPNARNDLFFRTRATDLDCPGLGYTPLWDIDIEGMPSGLLILAVETIYLFQERLTITTFPHAHHLALPSSRRKSLKCPRQHYCRRRGHGLHFLHIS